MVKGHVNESMRAGAFQAHANTDWLCVAEVVCYGRISRLSDNSKCPARQPSGPEAFAVLLHLPSHNLGRSLKRGIVSRSAFEKDGDWHPAWFFDSMHVTHFSKCVV